MFTAAVPRKVPIQAAELVPAYQHWWYEGNQRAYKDNQRIVGYLGEGVPGQPLDFSVVMDCYERETLEEIQRYYRNCPTTFIIVVRNIFNTIASMIKRRAHAPFFNMDVWKSLARAAVSDRQDGPVVVLFDKWHADKAYRKLIATRLGIEFTDQGRNEILDIGRASSFDQAALDGRAHEMGVLNRYEGIIGHPTVIRKVLSDAEAVELNEILFGEFMPRDLSL